MILERLRQKTARAYVSIYDFQDLFFEDFYVSEYSEVPRLRVLNQKFSEYKTFFKTLKNEMNDIEFLYSLMVVSSRISEVIDSIFESNREDDYFSEFPFDYRIVINFIERYKQFCICYNYDKLYRYQFLLEQESFRESSRGDKYLKSDFSSIKREYFIDENEQNKLYLKRIQKHLDNIRYKIDFDEGQFYNIATEFGIVLPIKVTDYKEYLELEYEKVKQLVPNKEYLIEEKENLINYEDSNLAQKMIALNELGVIEFLRENKDLVISNNKIATFLSLVLGENVRSVQSYLNPIINKSANQDKSPYASKKAVKEVMTKLSNIPVLIKNNSN